MILRVKTNVVDLAILPKMYFPQHVFTANLGVYTMFTVY